MGKARRRKHGRKPKGVTLLGWFRSRWGWLSE